MKSILFVTIIFLLFSCQRKTISLQTDDAYSAENNAPKISFIQLKVSKKEAVYEGQIVSRQEVAGILPTPFNPVKASEGQWLLRFLDNQENVLEQVVLENPFDMNVEFADDNGQFQNHVIKRNEAEFFFRVQYNTEFVRFEVEQILPNKKKKKLFSLNL